MDLHDIVAPLIGAVIGYFTNYIAVKMLFYPRREIRVLGHRLPFTPGAIPKGKNRLAQAAGTVVAENLMTKEDITKQLLSEEIEQAIVRAVLRQLHDPAREKIQQLAGFSEEDYLEKKQTLCEAISREIIESIDVQTLVQEQGGKFLKQKVQGSALSMILTEKRCQSIADLFAEELQTMVDQQGQDYVQPVVSQKIDSLDSQTPEELLQKIDVTETVLHDAIVDVYRKVIHENVDRMLEHIHIADVITDKINAMSVEEMEKLVFTMMKQELNTIVNLGALIGFVLGLVNLFL